MGLNRVILSRELWLDEVEELRQPSTDMEIEVFFHRALCIAYSGRCLLSGYFNHRDPNQGLLFIAKGEAFSIIFICRQKKTWILA